MYTSGGGDKVKTRYYTSMGKLMVFVLGFILITASYSGVLADTFPGEDLSFADDEFVDDEFADNVFVDNGENERAGQLYAYTPAVRGKDPFLPIQVKEMKPNPVPRPVRPVDSAPDIQITPPFKMDVLCIVGNTGDRLALIEFEGELLEVSVTFEAEGQFKVVDIGPDAVEVYSYSHRCRKTVKLQ